MEEVVAMCRLDVQALFPRSLLPESDLYTYIILVPIQLISCIMDKETKLGLVD